MSIYIYKYKYIYIYIHIIKSKHLMLGGLSKSDGASTAPLCRGVSTRRRPRARPLCRPESGRSPTLKGAKSHNRRQLPGNSDPKDMLVCDLLVCKMAALLL